MVFIGQSTEKIFIKHQETSHEMDHPAEGFRHLGYKDDPRRMPLSGSFTTRSLPICQEMVRQGKHNDDFVEWASRPGPSGC
jgi:hypothetical protein